MRDKSSKPAEGSRRDIGALEVEAAETIKSLAPTVGTAFSAAFT
jgi:hypothetical protein